MPTLNTTQPLTLYLHAERRLSKDLTSLFKFHALFRRAPSSKLSRVHQAQRLLLDVIYLIYIEGDESIKAPRGHLAYLPPEDHSELLDNYSENILYAAQALQSGYKIRGIETFTEELLEPADHLIQAFTSLRVAFTERAMKDTRPPYRDLDPILQTFDSAWVSFEKV